MRVLVVCNGFPPSGQWGTEFYSHQLATGLAGRGVTVPKGIKRTLRRLMEGS